MGIDLTNLMPEESWHPETWDSFTMIWLKSDNGKDTLEWLKKARPAFGIMMRRGWTAEQCNGGWRLAYKCFLADFHGEQRKRFAEAVKPAPDPFTALVEAEGWWITTVEKGQVSDG